jgi:hypothetical protein
LDYPFYTKKLGQIPDNLLARLRSSVIDKPYHQHPGFRQPVERMKDSFNTEDVKSVQQWLEPWIPASAYETYELIKLEPGQSVIEHSDICGDYNNRFWMAAHYHKIHIPLWTNDKCWSTHRRSKLINPEISTIEVGEVMVYNDYVWHTGVNNGNTTRVHICFAYFDPMWQYNFEKQL